ncbi:MAG TPA: hypothetical protein VFS39_17925, partial [Nitrospira sp.]|nr:hypothetical protein [Nitrospira sp.]
MGSTTTFARRFSLIAHSTMLVMSLVSGSFHPVQGQGKTEILPMQKTAPAAVVIETRGDEQALRK